MALDQSMDLPFCLLLFSLHRFFDPDQFIQRLIRKPLDDLLAQVVATYAHVHFGFLTEAEFLRVLEYS